MKIKNTYPPVPKKKLQRQKFLAVMRWPFLFAAVLCPLINIQTKGYAWSAVVLLSLYIVWRMVLSPDLVEYNRISQFIKLILCASAMIGLIDVVFHLGGKLAEEVLPIIGFGSLIVAAVLLFTDFESQKQNLLPLLWLILIAIIGAVIGRIVLQTDSWSITVMGGIAALLLCTVIILLRKDFLRELRRRFHLH